MGLRMEAPLEQMRLFNKWFLPSKRENTPRLKKIQTFRVCDCSVIMKTTVSYSRGSVLVRVCTNHHHLQTFLLNYILHPFFTFRLFPIIYIIYYGCTASCLIE